MSSQISRAGWAVISIEHERLQAGLKDFVELFATTGKRGAGHNELLISFSFEEVKCLPKRRAVLTALDDQPGALQTGRRLKLATADFLVTLESLGEHFLTGVHVGGKRHVGRLVHDVDVRRESIRRGTRGDRVFQSREGLDIPSRGRAKRESALFFMVAFADVRGEQRQ